MDRCWSRLIAALVLGTGFAVAWAIASGWLITTIYSISNPPVHQFLHFKLDGTPIVQDYSSGVQRSLDLEGHDVYVSDEEQWLDGALLYPSISRPPSLLPVDWNQRIVSFYDQQKPPVYWYFVTGSPTQDRAVFIGFDSASGRKVGYIGTVSFSEKEPPANECFAFTNRAYGELSSRVTSWQPSYHLGAVQPLSNYGSIAPLVGIPGQQRWTVFVLDDAGKVWRVSLRQRRVDVAHDQQPVLSFGLMGLFPYPRSAGQLMLVLRTADSVAYMNGMNEILKPISVPESIRSMIWKWAETVVLSPRVSGEGRFETYDPAKARRDILVQYSLPHDPWDDRRQERILRMDLAGHVKSDQVVSLQSQAPARAMRLGAGICFPGPIPVATFVAGFMPMEIESALPHGYGAALGASLTYFAPSVVIAVAIALIAAVVVYRRERQYDSPLLETLLWVLFVLLTGIPGWIGYRYSRRWPVLEACPACGKPAPRDRLECAHCRAEFPLPDMTGTEILVDSAAGVQ
jgi:hypothetical protein